MNETSLKERLLTDLYCGFVSIFTNNVCNFVQPIAGVPTAEKSLTLVPAPKQQNISNTQTENSLPKISNNNSAVVNSNPAPLNTWASQPTSAEVGTATSKVLPYSAQPYYNVNTYGQNGQLPEQISRYINPAVNVLQTVIPGEIASMNIHGLIAGTLNGIAVSPGSNAYNILNPNGLPPGSATQIGAGSAGGGVGSGTGTSTATGSVPIIGPGGTTTYIINPASLLSPDPTSITNILGGIVNIASATGTNMFTQGSTIIQSLANNILTALNTLIQSTATTTLQSGQANVLNAPINQLNASNTQISSSQNTNITSGSSTNISSGATTTISSGSANVFNAPLTLINSSTTQINGALVMGTTTPTAGKLATFYGDIDVTGTIDPTRILFSNKAGAGSPSFNPMTDGAGNYRIEFTEGAGLNFKSASTNNVLQLNSDGNIGMGTVAPSANLHISSNNSETKAKFQNNAGVYSIGVGNVSGPLYFGNDAMVIKNENTNTELVAVSQNYTNIKNSLNVANNSILNGQVVINGLLSASEIKGYNLELTNTKSYNAKNTVAFKYWPSGVTDHYETQEIFNASIYALTTDDNIRASEFHATSDERIKNIKGYSNSELDLENLNKILITDYTLKADELSTTSPIIQKKVIAQQIEKITPNLVTKSKGFIPVEPYYVNFVKNGTTTDLYIGGNKYTGDKKFKYQHKDRTTGIWEKNTLAKISIGEAVITDEEVDDFRTVDYDGLTTLAISGLQELNKKVGLKATNTDTYLYTSEKGLAFGVDEIAASSTVSINDKIKALAIGQKEFDRMLKLIDKADNYLEENVNIYEGGVWLQKTVDTILGKLFKKVKAWLGNPLNGVAKIFTDSVETKKMCMTDDAGETICITKEQLKNIIIKSGQEVSVENTSTPVSNIATGTASTTEILTNNSTTTDLNLNSTLTNQATTTDLIPTVLGATSTEANVLETSTSTDPSSI